MVINSNNDDNNDNVAERLTASNQPNTTEATKKRIISSSCETGNISEKFTQTQSNDNLCEYKNGINHRIFTKKIPSNGVLICLYSEDFNDADLRTLEIFNRLKAINTCSIDYLILSFWL